jgi:hypothetical protein
MVINLKLKKNRLKKIIEKETYQQSKSYNNRFLTLIFIIITAIIINKIPIHCQKLTVSFRIMNAIKTETGNSKAETILPNPIPVNGKPAFNNIGGITVPKSAIKIPHL